MHGVGKFTWTDALTYEVNRAYTCTSMISLDSHPLSCTCVHVLEF